MHVYVGKPHEKLQNKDTGKGGKQQHSDILIDYEPTFQVICTRSSSLKVDNFVYWCKQKWDYPHPVYMVTKALNSHDSVSYQAMGAYVYIHHCAIGSNQICTISLLFGTILR